MIGVDRALLTQCGSESYDYKRRLMIEPLFRFIHRGLLLTISTSSMGNVLLPFSLY